MVPQVKICGLTRVDQALACVGSGADAIGLVFYTKSPRNVSRQRAREISSELPAKIAKIGVFVDASFGFVMRRVETCGLTMVQLHGNESPGLVTKLVNSGVSVIKSLFLNREPGFSQARRFAAAAYLLECGQGALPGGNAMAWDFEKAGYFGKSNPLVLAGGLSPENVSAAIQSACPDAVDVSSGVETRPGIKDPYKVRLFMEAVRKTKLNKHSRRIF